MSGVIFRFRLQSELERATQVPDAVLPQFVLPRLDVQIALVSQVRPQLHRLA